MICSECGKEATECDLCGVEFGIGDDIICMDGGDEHLCEECLDGWLQEHHSWSLATVEKEDE